MSAALVTCTAFDVAAAVPAAVGLSAVSTGGLVLGARRLRKRMSRRAALAALGVLSAGTTGGLLVTVACT